MRKLEDTDRHLVDSIADLLESAGGLDRVRRLQAGLKSFDRATWTKLAEAGWLGAAVPEAQGGAGLARREILLLLEEAGKRLMPEPLVPALAASMILAASGAVGASLLAEFIAGKKVVLPLESDAGALRVEGGRLSGATTYLVDGHAGDMFLVLAEQDGVAQVLVVTPRAPGVTPESDDTVDGGTIARLRFDRAPIAEIAVLGRGEGIAAAVAAAADFARLGYAALLVGLMDEALAVTVQYLKDRKQFGVPIGSFQALQHRAASLYVTSKASHALLYEAARAEMAPRRTVAALAAKSYAAETAMQAVKECVALHGAIGYTAEYKMSLYFRRAMALAVAGGDAIACRKRLHALGADTAR